MMVKSEDIQSPHKSCSSIIGNGSKQLTRMNQYELRIFSVIDYRRINKRVKERSIEMATSSCHMVQHMIRLHAPHQNKYHLALVRKT